MESNKHRIAVDSNYYSKHNDDKVKTNDGVQKYIGDSRLNSELTSEFSCFTPSNTHDVCVVAVDDNMVENPFLIRPSTPQPDFIPPTHISPFIYDSKKDLSMKCLLSFIGSIFVLSLLASISISLLFTESSLNSSASNHQRHLSVISGYKQNYFQRRLKYNFLLHNNKNETLRVLNFEKKRIESISNNHSRILSDNVISTIDTNNSNENVKQVKAAPPCQKICVDDEDDIRYTGPNCVTCETTFERHFLPQVIAVQLVLVFFLAMWLAWSYAKRESDYFYLGLVHSAWYSGFAGALLLPLDLAVSQANFKVDISTGKNRPQGVLFIRYIWVFLYWFTFFLSNIVLPLAMHHHASGQFDWWSRTREYLRERGYFIIACISIFVPVYLYYIAVGMGGEIYHAVMILQNMYGMGIIIFLLGYGMVNVPRTFYKLSDPKKIISTIEYGAIRKINEYTESQKKIRETVLAIYGVQKVFQNTKWKKKDIQDKNYMRFCVRQMLLAITKVREKCDGDLDRLILMSGESSMLLTRYTRPWDNKTKFRDKITQMAKIFKDFKVAVCAYEHSRSAFLNMLSNWEYYDDMINHRALPEVSRTDCMIFHNRQVAKENKNMHQEAILREGLTETDITAPKKKKEKRKKRHKPPLPWCGTIALRECKFSCHKECGYVFYNTLAGIAFSFSIVIAWSEATVWAPVDFLSPLGDFIAAASVHRVTAELFAFIPFAMINYFVFGSLLTFKAPSFLGRTKAFHVYPNHETDVLALMYQGKMMCRIQFALGYNYLIMLRFSDDPTELYPCAFADMFDRASPGSAIGWVLNILSCFTVIVFFLVLFNAYDKAVAYFCSGMSHLIEEEVDCKDYDARVIAGRQEIERYLEVAERSRKLAKAKKERMKRIALKRRLKHERKQQEMATRDDHAWARFDERTDCLNESQRTALALDHTVDGVFQEVISLRRSLADQNLRESKKASTGKTTRREHKNSAFEGNNQDGDISLQNRTKVDSVIRVS